MGDGRSSTADGIGDLTPHGESQINLGPTLRTAWIGYQLRLDQAMEAAGFGERRFPDGRVLRLCSTSQGLTISAIGREIGITRQGATKVVTRLADRDYVAVADSASSGRDKSVTLTDRGVEYLQAQRRAARRIEREIRGRLGETGFAALTELLEALGTGDDQLRLWDYLRRT